MNSGSFPKYRDLPRDASGLYRRAWGVFGVDDQLGTLNHLSPERVLSALATVRTGQVINLNLPLDFFDPPLIAHRGLPRHEVFGLNEFHRDDRIDGFFPQAGTQLDSLRHFAHPDNGFYNGIAGKFLVAGSPDLGIQEVAERGISGRGLLVDIDAYRTSIGSPIDQGINEQLSVADLDGALAYQGSVVLAGDILLIRTGWLTAVRAGQVSIASGVVSPGLAQSEDIAEWMWDHKVALAAADNIALEAWPPERENLPTLAESEGRLEHSSHTGMLHRLLIPLLGLTIGELWDMDTLAEACKERGSYSFLLVSEPLNLTGGVGSPANALAII
jgi:kynurenine formamidase